MPGFLNLRGEDQGEPPEQGAGHHEQAGPMPLVYEEPQERQKPEEAEAGELRPGSAQLLARGENEEGETPAAHAANDQRGDEGDKDNDPTVKEPLADEALDPQTYAHETPFLKGRD